MQTFVSRSLIVRRQPFPFLRRRLVATFRHEISDLDALQPCQNLRLRPFHRFQNHGLSFPAYSHAIAVETKRLGQPDRLAATDLEKLRFRHPRDVL